MIDDDMRTVVDEQRLGFIATVRSDGTPNLSPKGTIAVWDELHLTFLDLASPVTVANLRERPAVEINVVDVLRRRGYRFRGLGEVLTDGPVFSDVVDFFERARGVARSRARHVVLVEVTEVRPLYSPAYENRSPEEIESQWKQYWTAHWNLGDA